MQSLVRLALTSPVVELRFPPKPRLAVDLFIDHVARNAILQVFVYDNSPHQTVWRWFLVFCFHFSPHSEIFRRKKSRCAMTHADFTCEWSISMGCLHSLCKFYWVKILRNNDFMMEPSSGNIGDAEASTRVVKIYSAHKTRLALKIHNKKNVKRDDLLVLQIFHGTSTCFIALRLAFFAQQISWYHPICSQLTSTLDDLG